MKNSKQQQRLIALCKEVNSRLHLCLLGMELRKLAKRFEFVVFPTYFNVNKQYGVFIYNQRSESDVFMLTIQLLLKLFYVIFYRSQV